MSLARKTVHGAMWTIGTSFGARAVGLVGTVVITYFLAPDVVAEVNAAAILVMSGSLLSNFGLGNYYIVKGDEAPDAGFHMTVWSMTLGCIGLALVWLLGDRMSTWFDLPDMAQYVPGLIVAAALRRVGAQPAKVLVRQMRFGRVGMSSAVGEITFVAFSVGLAAYGWGGYALVVGNIFQAGAEALLLITGVSWRTWLGPCRLSWERTRDMFRFGVPLGINGFINFVSQSWDRMIYAYFFGPARMGLYHYAYRLAEIPASQLGEHAGNVLLPSMSKLAPGARPRALIRSTALLGLLLFPLTLGLATVAETVVTTIFDEQWHGIAPLVTILSVISVFQPVGYTLGSYLISLGRTRTLMLLEIVKIMALVAGMALFSLLGPLWICAGVGASFAVHALAGAWICVRYYHVSARGFFWAFTQPLLACVPMVAAVLATRHVLRALGTHEPPVLLAAEVLTGALVYVPSALTIAPGVSRDFLGLVKKALSRQRPAREGR